MAMQIDLTPEQDDVVRHAIAAGRIARPEEAVAQAMDDWVERERQRFDLIASLDEAEAEYERGDYLTIETEEDGRAFVKDVMERCCARLAADEDWNG